MFVPTERSSHKKQSYMKYESSSIHSSKVINKVKDRITEKRNYGMMEWQIGQNFKYETSTFCSKIKYRFLLWYEHVESYAL